MTDTNSKVHILIATLLANIEPDERTKKSDKVRKNYRTWLRKMYRKDPVKYKLMASKTQVAWTSMNEILDKQGDKELISLPVTLLALTDMVQGGKAERVVNQDLFTSMIEGQSDYSCRNAKTEAAALEVADILRPLLGVPPRKKLSFIKQALATKKFNDILEEG